MEPGDVVQSDFRIGGRNIRRFDGVDNRIGK
jgi:hypothetical protein